MYILYGLQDTDSTSSAADSSQVRRQRRHRPVAPPGLELMEDINPGYDTGKAPPFTVPMEAVAKGGVVFDTAMRSLEVLERADCNDLWQVCRYLYVRICMDGWMSVMHWVYAWNACMCVCMYACMHACM